MLSLTGIFVALDRPTHYVSAGCRIWGRGGVDTGYFGPARGRRLIVHSLAERTWLCAPSGEIDSFYRAPPPKGTSQRAAH